MSEPTSFLFQVQFGIACSTVNSTVIQPSGRVGYSYSSPCSSS